MKIFYFISSLSNSGGIERIVTLKANYLAENTLHEIVIVTSDDKDQPSFFSLSKKVRLLQLDINYSETLQHNIIRRTFEYLGKQARHKQILKQLLKKEKPDILISTFGLEMPVVAEVKFGGKRILEYHFSKNSKFKEFKYNHRNILWFFLEHVRCKMNSFYIRRYDKFVVLTGQDRKLWNMKNNIEVIPNFISNDILFSEYSQYSNIVIAVGRFSVQKGFDRLLEIWRKVQDYSKDWKLLLVGNGECEGLLREKIEKYNLSDSVQLEQSTTRIYDFYKKAAIYVMTSRYEGFPMVLLEAKAFGLPTIAFDCECGPQEIIKDGKNGFLIKDDDEDDFIKKLLLLIQNSELRKKMSDNMLQGLDAYSEKNVMKQWIDLFDNLS